MTLPEETIVLEEAATTCFICHADLTGRLVKTSSLTELTDALVAKTIATVGVVCDHCDTRYCETHKKELNNNLWRGFTKSTCLKCGQIIGGHLTIVQLRSAKDYAEVPELMQVLGEMKLEAENADKLDAKYNGTDAQATYPADACPICGGTKISTSKIPAGSIKDRMFELIFGSVLLVLLIVATRLGGSLEISPTIWGLLQVVGLYIVLEMFWEGLTNRPLPIVGIRLFTSTKYDTRATCGECKFSWQVSKKE